MYAFARKNRGAIWSTRSVDHRPSAYQYANVNPLRIVPAFALAATVCFGLAAACGLPTLFESACSGVGYHALEVTIQNPVGHLENDPDSFFEPIALEHNHTVDPGTEVVPPDGVCNKEFQSRTPFAGPSHMITTWPRPGFLSSSSMRPTSIAPTALGKDRHGGTQVRASSSRHTLSAPHWEGVDPAGPQCAVAQPQSVKLHETSYHRDSGRHTGDVRSLDL